jgi:peptide/nickel transport system substrate-binding protein
MINDRAFIAILSLTAMALAQHPVAAEDGLVRVAAQRFPDSFGNPYAMIALPNTLALQAIFDPLTRVGPQGEVVPGLAVSWTQESPSTWVFALRPGVTFSNGEPFDAAAVVTALSYLQTDEGRRDSVASQDLKATLTSFRARDALTVEIVTAEPDPILPLHLSFIRIPAPGHWSALGRVEFQRHPVGTGPFKVDSWDEARLEMSAFAGSWRPPKVERVRVVQIGDPVVRAQAFASGAVDIASGLSPEDAPSVAAVGGRLLPRAEPIVHFLLFITTKDTPLKDVRVRQALNYAVNKDQILDSFLGGAVAPVGQFSHPMAFGFDPALAAYPYNPARARALLAEAGFGEGFAFTMLMNSTTGGGYTDWFQRIAQDFAAVGVTLTIRSTTTTRLIEDVQTGNWPVEAFAWTFAGFDSLRGYRFRSCGWVAPYHCDPAMTPLIAAAQSATSAVARLGTTRAALAHERGDPPGVMLWPGVGFDAVAAHVADYRVEEDVIRWESIRLVDR